jgi:fructokinase
MNEEEAQVLDATFALGGADPDNFIPALAERFDVATVCVTAGERGAATGTRIEIHACPGYSVAVADSAGAGDAFSAGLLTRLHAGAPLAEACDFGCRMGALVASKSGAVPVYTLAELDLLQH